MPVNVTELNKRWRLAEKIALKAGDLALKYFNERDQLVIETKKNAQDVVSIADRNVEHLIRDLVATEFPDDGFLGEEFGLTKGTSGFIWVVDPIDGTSPFVNGMPNWCVSISVVFDDKPVVGVINAPMMNEIYTSALGQGASMNGKSLKVNPNRTLQDSITGLGANHYVTPEEVGRLAAELHALGGNFFRNGSGALMLAYVAAGRLVGYYEPYMHSWDCMAGFCLAKEAGAFTFPFPIDGDQILTGSPVLAAAPGAMAELKKISRLS